MLADILSIVAIVLSVASFGWQVHTWYQSGAVVEVTALQSLPVYGPRGAGDWHVSITAINKGRSPVTVKMAGLKLPDGRQMAIMEYSPWSAGFSHRLEPGADASWYVDTDVIKRSCAGEGVRHQDMIAYVTLALATGGRSTPASTASAWPSADRAATIPAVQQARNRLCSSSDAGCYWRGIPVSRQAVRNSAMMRGNSALILALSRSMIWSRRSEPARNSSVSSR